MNMQRIKILSRKPSFSTNNLNGVSMWLRRGRQWMGAYLITLLIFLALGLSFDQGERSYAHAQGALATVICRLEPNPAYLGSQTELIIEVQDVDDLYGYQLQLTYDPNRIEVLDSDPEENGINLTLENIGASQTDSYVLKNLAENGTIEIVTTLLGQVPAFDGDVVLARGKIRGAIIGSAKFQFGEVILANGTPNPIPSQTVDCQGEFVPAVFLPVVTRNFEK